MTHYDLHNKLQQDESSTYRYYYKFMLISEIIKPLNANNTVSHFPSHASKVSLKTQHEHQKLIINMFSMVE